LQSGVILGHAELINGLLARITAELGARPHVLATGGAGAAFVPLCPAIEEYVPHLTLDGLRLAWARNGAA
jgi:type III pantothenate kinase